MQKLIVGIVIGIVVGTLFGASVIAPRLTPDTGEAGLQRTIGSETVNDGVTPPEGSIVETASAVDTRKSDPDSHGSKDSFSWDMASAFPSHMPLLGELPRRLESQISVLTGGVNSIRFHEPDTLAPTRELMEAVRSGAVDVAFTAPVLTANQIPALGLFGGTPFGPTASEMLAWMYAGGGLEELDLVYHARDLHALPCGLLSAAPAGWFDRQILSVDDLKGLRMRIDGLGARVVEKLGVQIASIPPQDVASAFKQGSINAAELSLPSADLPSKLHEVADYYYFPGWHQRSTVLVLLMRLESWQSLKLKNQEYLRSACGDNMRQSLAMGEATQLEALKIISGSGVEVLRFPQDVLTALANAWQQTAREQSEQDDEFARTWNSLQTFRRDFDIWFDLNQL
jgi:TRAP-type mannitol/chloroaromatic compound transport system substrate-binding protein